MSTRRRFLQYASLGAASFAFSACGERSPRSLLRLPKSQVNFGKLEKTALLNE